MIANKQMHMDIDIKKYYISTTSSYWEHIIFCVSEDQILWFALQKTQMVTLLRINSLQAQN